MTFIAKTFYDLRATTLEGDSVDFNENCSNGEIMNCLQHVRPGSGFHPNFTIFEKCDVNGTNTHPVFAYLKDKLPYPDDDPSSFMQDPKFLIWSPINRTDVSWNFEKFIVGPEGEPFKRYSKKFPTIDIEPDIQRLLRLTKS
ncbi:Glutathione peroxidase 2 [Collichthys lucidus]|uniref:glutathione peroxidase n=1 Tax=Collichthys lucidus TaxID=240159 RepID=A0A4U5VEU8_COLLU|nr:Glutathione peroxidase 2 [Collichthys lucidus]